jgi:hypothetical protein
MGTIPQRVVGRIRALGRMSLNAAALKLMAEKGLSAHDIVAIAEAMECGAARPDTAAERRRAWDRERKREQRELERLSGGQSGGMSARIPPDPAPNERDNLTPTRLEKTEAKASSKKFPEPGGVTAEQWQAFRDQRKKPLNDHSYVLLCNKLAKLADAGWPPGDMIDLAVERGWETVFAPRTNGNERTNTLGRHQPTDGLSSTARAGLAVFGH